MSGGAIWTRRNAMLAGMLGGLRSAWAGDRVPRVATLDWGWASALLCLGIAPVGVAEKRSYAAWVGEPALPPTTAELGLRTTPSLEILAALRPELILSNGLDAAIRPALERIAPTLSSPVFQANRTPLANAREAVLALGDRLSRPDAARAWLAESDRRFAAARMRLSGEAGRALICLQLVDSRNITYFGRGSLYGDVLEALGLRSAYSGATSQWGYDAGDIASVAGLPPADLLVVEPLPPESAALLDGPSLMASLVQAGGRRVYRLPPAWTFGELAAATRFAEHVANALAPRRTGAARPVPAVEVL